MSIRHSELRQSLYRTRQQIETLNLQETMAAGSREIKRLRRKRKELQILQLWTLDQCNWLEDNG